MIKVTVLAENTPQKPDFACEHGLSLYIETQKHKILFDSGQTSVFSRNATLLGTDLSKVDIAVLDETVKVLNSYSTFCYTCHCTGVE